MTTYTTLEYDTILSMLADCAVSTPAKEACLKLVPQHNAESVTRLLNQTTQAKNILEVHGNPPIAQMANLASIIQLLQLDSMLTVDNLESISVFFANCARMQAYLARAQATGVDIAFYGNAMLDLTHAEEEINRCIQNGAVSDRATPALGDCRRAIERKVEQIKSKIESLLKANSQYCADSFVAVRNGRYTMPVKKKFKNKIPGVVVELSNTGGTCFIEPSAIAQLQEELFQLQIQEDNEIRIILYTLTAMVYDNLPAIKTNMEAMEVLDFVFAKGKLSQQMHANAIQVTARQEVTLLNARHPLLSDAVPLNFTLGGNHVGIIVTGPNTGGKTVAIKTVGLFSIMTQAGLHVPACEKSTICIFDDVFCDIGDGQSISQNLSTFSSHMTNIIGILEKITPQSLVLFDELGSGTDPAEGMGIATAILEELLTKNCLFTVTTHYPEIKEFAKNTPGVVNARMAFDRVSLKPLYRLEIGEAGESSAIYIAQRLGLAPHILQRARDIVYSGNAIQYTADDSSKIVQVVAQAVITKEKVAPNINAFDMGDNVKISPNNELGIVYKPANSMGEVIVQIKGEKHKISHKRLKLHVAAKDMYPEDYDFSIIFDTVENRKARHTLDRKHQPGVTVVVKE